VTEPAAEPVKLKDLSRNVAWVLAREHPTLGLTLAYLALTFVGMIHDLWFYFYFKINILDFSETSDFLLAAIRNPLVIILSLLPIALLFGVQRVRETARKKSARYDAFATKYDRSRWNSVSSRLSIYGLFIVIYAIVFTQLYAEWESERVKAGKGRRLAFVRNDGVISDEQPILLGTTGKFLFLYYPSRKATEIVPIDNATVLTVDSRRRKEREADSAAAFTDSGGAEKH
jgi:hypothetical protein